MERGGEHLPCNAAGEEDMEVAADPGGMIRVVSSAPTRLPALEVPLLCTFRFYSWGKKADENNCTIPI